MAFIKGKICHLCEHIFSDFEAKNLDFILEHTTQCLSYAYHKENKTCVVSSCTSCNIRNESSWKRAKLSHLEENTNLFDMSCHVLSLYVEVKDLLSFALVNRAAFVSTKARIANTLWFNATANQVFQCYQPTQLYASDPSQFLPNITKLKLFIDKTSAEPISFPPSITYLDITKVSVPLVFNWPSIHTLLIGEYYKPLEGLPEGLQVLKFINFKQSITSLPQSITELHGISWNEVHLLPLPHLKILNGTCTILNSDYNLPASVCYIDSLMITGNIPIPQSLVINKLCLDLEEEGNYEHCIPHSVKQLELRDIESVPYLPPNLTYLLIVNKLYRIELPILPESLEVLILDCYVDHFGQLPRKLRDLRVLRCNCRLPELPNLEHLFCPELAIEEPPPTLKCLKIIRMGSEDVVAREFTKLCGYKWVDVDEELGWDIYGERTHFNSLFSTFI